MVCAVCHRRYLAGWGYVLSRDVMLYVVWKWLTFRAHPDQAPQWFTVSVFDWILIHRWNCSCVSGLEDYPGKEKTVLRYLQSRTESLRAAVQCRLLCAKCLSRTSIWCDTFCVHCVAARRDSSSRPRSAAFMPAVAHLFSFLTRAFDRETDRKMSQRGASVRPCNAMLDKC